MGAETDPQRRSDVTRATPAEQAIRRAMEAVESLPPDERLTHAVIALDAALTYVADYVDGVPLREGDG